MAIDNGVLSISTIVRGVLKMAADPIRETVARKNKVINYVCAGQAAGQPKRLTS